MYFFFFFQHGVSLHIQDKEGLSPLDLLMKDRPTHVVFKNTGKDSFTQSVQQGAVLETPASIFSD